MSAGVIATIRTECTITEELGDAYISTNATADKTLKFLGFNSTLSLTGAGGVPIAKQAVFEKVLSSGAGTIDLRALVNGLNAAVDGNGMKVQYVEFRAKSTNANPITITPGASNGYLLFGTAFSLTLKATQWIKAYLAELATDIDGTHKTIDLAGTGAQSLEVVFLIG